MKAKYYATGIIVLILLALVVLMNGDGGPGYSVVYFDNSTLPSSLYLGNVTTVIFGIHSYEHTETSYSFDVYLNGQMIKNGSVSLSPHQNVQIPVKLLIKNVTYSKILTKNTTTSYLMSGILNMTTSCALVNSSGNWSCSPPIYKGALGLSFILNKTGNISVNKTTYTLKGNDIVVTVQTLSIIREGPQKYRVVLGTLEWTRVKNNALLQVIVRSSTGRVYVLSHSFSVVGG